MQKRTIEIVDQLKRYFGLKVIGSYLLVEANLLSEDDVNDIDLAVEKGSDLTDRVKRFLMDHGFDIEVVTKVENNSYKNVDVRYKFKSSEYDKIIDLNIFTRMPDIYTTGELIKAKFESGRTDDLKQLAMVIFNKAGNTVKAIKTLQEFYEQNKSTEDETTG